MIRNLSILLNRCTVLLSIYSFFAVYPVLASQETEPYTYPLEQVLSIAQSNATELKIITTEADASRAEAEMYRANAFPQISFGSSATYTSSSQATQKMQQAIMFALFPGDTSSSVPENSAPSSSQAESSGGIPYPDRMNGYAFDWSLNLQQPLITFGKVSSALKLARMRRCTIKDLVRLKSDLFYLRVMQEFSAAYLAQCDVSINRASRNRAQQILIRTTSEFEAGRAIKRDQHRVKALVQREQANLIAAEGQQTTATYRLLKTICFDDSTRYIPLEINQKGAMSIVPPSSGPGSIQIALKKNEAAMYKEQYRFIRSAYFPTINLIGSITNQFMTIDTNGLTKDFFPSATQETLAEKGKIFDEYNPMPYKYFDPNYFNYAIGLQLTWTLFDGNRTRAQCRQAKSNLEKSLLELEKLKSEDRIAIEEAKNQITTIDSMSAAVSLQIDAAREAFKQTELDYKDGFTDFTTLLDTDKEYRDAVRMLNGLRIQRILAYAQLRITMGLPVFGETE